jgi:chromosomal replication initiator protein
MQTALVPTPSQMMFHVAREAAHNRLWNGPQPLRDARPALSRMKALLGRVQARQPAHEAIAFLPVPSERMPKWRRIAIEVCHKHGVSMVDVLSSRRDRSSVAARHEAFYRCKEETTMSLPSIGRMFGGRDHSTVIHGIAKHKQRMAADA